jgi:hypothetical protein
MFVDPTGFDAQTTSTPGSYNFPKIGTITANVKFLGDGISLGTRTLDFDGPGLSNPSWMGGTREMFNINYDGSASGGPRELMEIEFVFSTRFSNASYMLFNDFDSEEGVAIAAFDVNNSLIPFADLTLTRVDGEQPGGASSLMPLWLDYNPTNDWASGNSPWSGTGAVSGFLVDTEDDSNDDVGVAISSSRTISRVVYYVNMETDSTGGNNLRFNFASPVPEPGSIAIFGIGMLGAYGRYRRRNRN